MEGRMKKCKYLNLCESSGREMIHAPVVVRDTPLIEERNIIRRRRWASIKFTLFAEVSLYFCFLPGRPLALTTAISSCSVMPVDGPRFAPWLVAFRLLRFSPKVERCLWIDSFPTSQRIITIYRKRKQKHIHSYTYRSINGRILLPPPPCSHRTFSKKLEIMKEWGWMTKHFSLFSA